MPPGVYLMNHPDISGTAKTSLVAFTAVWEPKGWELVITVEDVVQYPAPLRFRGGWVSTARYEYGDVVDRSNVGYIANVTNINEDPTTHPATWEDIPGQTPSGVAGGIGTAGGVAYVDPVNGDDNSDGTAPFATIQGALDVLQPDGPGLNIWFGCIYLSRGVHDVGDGLDTSGYSCTLKGAGPYNQTVLWASTQTRAVLFVGGFPDWLGGAGSHHGVEHFGGFTLRGSGVAGSAKHGLHVTNITNITFRDIDVEDISCGGSGLYLDGPQTSTFQNVVLGRPLNNTVTNQPYAWQRGPAFGNKYINIGTRSLSGAADGSSCWKVDDGGIFGVDPSGVNIWRDCWSEFNHIPTNGSYFDFQANNSRIYDFQSYDTSGATATNNQFIRFRPPSSDIGGNLLSGYIPGNGLGTARGVLMEQSRNGIIGLAGFLSDNIVITSGVGGTNIVILGQEAGTVGVISPRVTDNSGQVTNCVLELNRNRMQVGNNYFRLTGSDGAGINSAFEISGHLQTIFGGTVPSKVETIGGSTVTVLNGSTDMAGQVSIVTAGASGAGSDLCLINFFRAYSNVPIIVLTPVGNNVSVGGVAMAWQVGAHDGSNFRIYSANGYDNATYRFNWHVIGWLAA